MNYTAEQRKDIDERILAVNKFITDNQLVLQSIPFFQAGEQDKDGNLGFNFKLRMVLQDTKYVAIPKEETTTGEETK